MKAMVEKFEVDRNTRFYLMSNRADSESVTGLNVFKDMASVQRCMEAVLRKHPDWKVGSVKIDSLESGGFEGTITFKRPTGGKGRKSYLVTWKEHSICSVKVSAYTAEEAKELAENEFPDREYLPDTCMRIKELD